MKISSKLQLAVLIVFILLATGLVIFTSLTATNTAVSTDTEASSVCKCTDADVCYPDGCSRKPKKDDGSFSESRYDSVCSQFSPGYRMPDELFQHFCSVQQPDCCFDIKRYGDSRLCCWQERYTCHPSLCEGSSGGDGCGKYWTYHSEFDGNPGSYGCIQHDGAGNTQPVFGLPPNLPGNQQPTTPPQSTNTPIPTATVAQGPTNTPAPTNTPVPNIPTHTTAPNQPTNTPPPSNTPVPNIPTSQPTQQAGGGSQPIGVNPQIPTNPTIPPQNNPLPELPSKQEVVASLDTTTAKPLAVVNTSYNVVISADQQLEDLAESWIFRLRVAISKLFR